MPDQEEIESILNVPSNIKKWETGLIKANFLGFINLFEEGDLRIRVRELSEWEPFKQYEINFRSCPFYRSWHEIYGDVWKESFDKREPFVLALMQLGPLLLIEPSEWKEGLMAKMYFSSFNENAKHFVVITTNRCIEVISNGKPEIRELKSLSLEEVKQIEKCQLKHI